MHITLIEPFFTGSHKQWATDFKQHSTHTIDIVSLPGRHWKWRMHGAAVSLAEKVNENNADTDLLLCTDMLDVATFKGLLHKKLQSKPVALYFHENQITYPWSEKDRDKQKNRDNHYGFINFTSALAADLVLFNSAYHKDSFINALDGFLHQFPDFQEKHRIKEIEAKSKVLHLGIDLQKFDPYRPEEATDINRGVILWNHRWEYDKNPDAFFNALFTLKERGIEFKLIVLGEAFDVIPESFERAKTDLQDWILHYGYCEKFEDYARWMFMADILPVTSIQDFFGISLVEALYCDVKPLLPKRLAYPEHIPDVYQGSFFYDNEADLVNRLQRLLFNVKVIRKQATQQIVDKYDWSKMINQYDRTFDELQQNTE